MATKSSVSSLSFAAQVDRWTRRSEQRMLAVFREASEEVISQMQNNVPVDTGFLRSSLQVGVNTEPVKADKPNPKNSVPQYVSTVASLVIMGAQLGDKIVASYSANYAPHVEYGTKNKDGTQRMYPRAFVRRAAAQWQRIVKETIVKAKARASS